MIEILGVLAIIAIIAAIMVPSAMASLRRTERQNETKNLEALADGLNDYILRVGSIPDASNWAQVVADELAMPLSKVEVNQAGWKRKYVVDSDLRIGITSTSTLPYSQTIQGSIFPVSPRVILVSSLMKRLPAFSSADFDAMWDSNPNTIPATWSSDWDKYALDVKFQRIDFSEIFYRLILNNVDSSNDAQFSIQTQSATTLSASTFVERWYLKHSAIGLRFTDGSLQLQEVLDSDRSYVFQNGSWGRKLGQGGDGSGDFGDLVEDFIDEGLAPNSGFGVTQQAVINEMYWYMWSYSIWANEGFTKGGASADQQVPSFRVVKESQTRLEDFSINLIK